MKVHVVNFPSKCSFQAADKRPRVAVPYTKQPRDASRIMDVKSSIGPSTVGFTLKHRGWTMHLGEASILLYSGDTNGSWSSLISTSVGLCARLQRTQLSSFEVTQSLIVKGFNEEMFSCDLPLLCYEDSKPAETQETQMEEQRPHGYSWIKTTMRGYLPVLYLISHQKTD